MRLIVVLVTLLIVGLLVQKQLGGSSTVEQAGPGAQSVREGAPRVPTNPGQLQAFEEQMGDYMVDEAERRAREIEAAERQ